MAKKSGAHERLSLLFAHEGVPIALAGDGVREQVMVEFRHKARQADCHVKQLNNIPHGKMQQKAP